jgi:hypothetical protein
VAFKRAFNVTKSETRSCSAFPCRLANCVCGRCLFTCSSHKRVGHNDRERARAQFAPSFVGLSKQVESSGNRATRTYKRIDLTCGQSFATYSPRARASSRFSCPAHTTALEVLEPIGSDCSATRMALSDLICDSSFFTLLTATSLFARSRYLRRLILVARPTKGQTSHLSTHCYTSTRLDSNLSLSICRSFVSERLFNQSHTLSRAFIHSQPSLSRKQVNANCKYTLHYAIQQVSADHL